MSASLLRSVAQAPAPIGLQNHFIHIRHSGRIYDGYEGSRAISYERRFRPRLPDGRSRTRPGMREHGEKEAERIVRNGMKTLVGSPGAASLAAMRKSDERKILLACLLRERTSVSNEWIATRLSMGHPGSVSRMVSAARTDKHLKGKCRDLCEVLFSDQDDSAQK